MPPTTATNTLTTTSLPSLPRPLQPPPSHASCHLHLRYLTTSSPPTPPSYPPRRATLTTYLPPPQPKPPPSSSHIFPSLVG
ncbi:hypothetical protein Tco_1140291 [Tanacetum coccineum]